MYIHKQFNKYLINQSFIEEFQSSDYTICSLRNNTSFYCDGEDFIKGLLVKGTIWELPVMEVIYRHVKEDSIAIDVGAHIGIHTITMSSRVGEKGKVIAFEPQKKIHRELIMNCKLNNCLNVIPLYTAVGEYNGIAYLGREEEDNEGGRHISSKYPTEIVPMVTLDQFHLDNISFIKIDVESYEKEVLEGAIETILQNKPAILLEIGGGREREKEEGIDPKEYHLAVINILENVLNYTVNRIEGRNFLALPL